MILYFYLKAQSLPLQILVRLSTLSSKYQPVCGNETSFEFRLSLWILQQM